MQKKPKELFFAIPRQTNEQKKVNLKRIEKT